MKRDAILTCDQNPNCSGVSAAVDADTTKLTEPRMLNSLEAW